MDWTSDQSAVNGVVWCVLWLVAALASAAALWRS